MQEIPSLMLEGISEEYHHVIDSWWCELKDEMKIQLNESYESEPYISQKFLPLCYYLRFIEKENGLLAIYEYVEGRREYLVNHEIGLNYKLESFNTTKYLQGGTASSICGRSSDRYVLYLNEDALKGFLR